ncbi:hypothetical protein MPEAHAMD_2432 [Methylobacterium frigidaeris]|uniref:Exopolysaccharide biosynthesis protein exod n=1 Tax=Methylobacterium frigidaeris TaxID=2038277 RepID=A0AA37HAI2_9HYPH|nr:hypothetical protein MPEAHAMD_2432 [Methylobacterium frigidaeris]
MHRRILSAAGPLRRRLGPLLAAGPVRADLGAGTTHARGLARAAEWARGGRATPARGAVTPPASAVPSVEGAAIPQGGASPAPDGQSPVTQFARTSEVLTVLAAQETERLTVGDIVAVLRDRAFALLVVLLGLPNCLPMPPPIPLICGLLLALVAAQIAAGMSAPWLPRALLGRSIARADLQRAVSRAVPLLRRLERWSRPRLRVFENDIGMRTMGLLLLALSLVLIVAAPLVGQIPLGLAVTLVGLGLVERDGIVVAAGLGVGVLGVALNLGFVYAVFTAVIGLLNIGAAAGL